MARTLKSKVQFNTRKDIEDFVTVANKQKFNITLKFGVTEVDGKSILGVVLLPLQSPIEIIISFGKNMPTDIIKIFKRWFI